MAVCLPVLGIILSLRKERMSSLAFVCVCKRRWGKTLVGE